MKGIKYEVYWNGTNSAVLIAPWELIKAVAEDIEQFNETLNDNDKDD